jgi:hypothetical protein
MSKSLVAILAIALAGCSSMDLKAVKEREPLYSTTVKGQHSVLAGCAADAFQTHKSWNIRSINYTVRNYPEANRSAVQAYIPSMYSGMMIVFLLDFKQMDSNNVQVEMRSPVKEYSPFVEQTLLFCSAQA